MGHELTYFVKYETKGEKCCIARHPYAPLLSNLFYTTMSLSLCKYLSKTKQSREA
jgi:hypothetical protein